MHYVPASGAASWNNFVTEKHDHHNKPILEESAERNPTYQLIFDFHISSRQNAAQNRTPVLSPISHTLGTVNKFELSGSSNYLSEVKYFQYFLFHIYI
jgi:hypothetical protein